MRITPAHSSRRLWAVLNAIGLSLVGLTALAPVAAGAPAAPPAAPYGAYVPITPARVLDTRSGFGTTHAGPVGAGQVLTTALAGRGGLPAAANISAVVVNLTVTAPTSGTYLTAYPADVTRPTVSSINVPAGLTAANLVTLPLHANGSVSVFNSSGSVQVLIDVLGYYSALDPGNGNGGYSQVTPRRKFDSRDPASFTGGAPFGDGDGVVVGYDFKSAASNAAVTAMVVTVTVVSPTAGGYVVAWDGTGTSLPPTSTLNFRSGQTVANLAIVPRGSDGTFPAFTAVVRVPGGTAHVLVDSIGVMTTSDPAAGGDDARFAPLPTPTRLIDTRNASTGGPALGAGQARGFGQGSIGDASSYAIAGNLTAVFPTATTFLTVYPSDVTRPTVSSVNAGPSQVVASGALVPLSLTSPRTLSDEFRIFNGAGTTNVILDVAGTFQIATPPAGAPARAGTVRGAAGGLRDSSGPAAASRRAE